MSGCGMPENLNVLLLEDDEVDVEAVRRLFRKNNIKNPIFHATSGIDGLKMLRGENDHPRVPQPYIMLVDINMPKMNGLDFLKEVRKDESLNESIAFILTTSSRDTDIAIAYELNAAGYFLKENMHELVNLLSVYGQINRFPGSAHAC